MTPTGFMALRCHEQALEDREGEIAREIVATCQAQIDLPARELHRVAHDAAEAQLRAKLQRAFEAMAETIRARLVVREQIEAEPLAHVAAQKGTRH